MKHAIVGGLMFLLTVVYAETESEKFLIKHRSSGHYLSQFVYSTVLYEYSGITSQWTFERVIQHWGYVKEVHWQWFLQPSGGNLKPKDETTVWIDNARHWGALWALDGANDHLIHKGGSYMHPESGLKPPASIEFLVIRKSVHDGMRFQFVSPDDINKHVLVYGKPTMIGDWHIINMVRNAIAQHVNTLEIKVGKSMTQSRTTSFQYSWEISVGYEGFGFSAETTMGFQYMAEITSSATWSTETTRTRQITVYPGTTVITWQYVFEIEQNESKGVYQSDMLADTDSETKKPAEVEYRAE